MTTYTVDVVKETGIKIEVLPGFVHCEEQFVKDFSTIIYPVESFKEIVEYAAKYIGEHGAGFCEGVGMILYNTPYNRQRCGMVYEIVSEDCFTQ